MPIGYLVAVGVTAIGTLLAVVPLRRSGRLGLLSWLPSAVPCESPFLACSWVLAVTALALAQGDLGRAGAGIGTAAGVVTAAGGVVLVRRALRAGPVVRRALDDGLGPGWRASVGPSAPPAVPGRLPWTRIVATPLPLFPRGVRRRSNLPYGDGGRRHRLDVYQRRSEPPAGPILIHLHGGAFFTGRKSFEARPLLHRLARHGWVCISADYRLRPAAAWPDFLVDVKQVIAWARCHADELGADPDLVFVAGSSAGANLAVTAALTAADERFQPGFESADTAVAGAVGLYGYYGPVDPGGPTASSPADFVHPDAPPMLIAHGDQDTLVAPANARDCVERLRAASSQPVVHVELPGAQHSFDLVHSVRFETLITGIEAFAAWVIGVRGGPATPGAGPTRSSPTAEG